MIKIVINPCLSIIISLSTIILINEDYQPINYVEQSRLFSKLFPMVLLLLGKDKARFMAYEKMASSKKTEREIIG